MLAVLSQQWFLALSAAMFAAWLISPAISQEHSHEGVVGRYYETWMRPY